MKQQTQLQKNEHIAYMTALLIPLGFQHYRDCVFGLDNFGEADLSATRQEPSWVMYEILKAQRERGKLIKINEIKKCLGL